MPGHIGSSSSNVTGGGDDIAELRALLADGGLTNGVLEGKFLNQVRRTRQLGVQLECEKTRTRQLEAQVAAFAEEKQKLSDASSSKPNPRPMAEEDPQQSVSALRERLDRAYAQLNETKVQLEEQRRESQRMRRLLQQEIGGTAQDVDALLQNPQPQQHAVEPSGWRGRAQQIVLLKGRVKELQRALANAHSSHPPPGATSSAGNTDSNSSEVAELASARRDVDDVARERVAAVQGRRLQQQRELQEALNQRAAEVNAQRQRADAAAARHANLEANNQTLRECLQSLVCKTENDNDLIAAYREELVTLRDELHETRIKLRELEQWQQGETPEQRRAQQKQKEDEEQRRGRGRKGVENEHALDNGTAIALAGADAAMEVQRLKMENVELRERLQSGKQETAERSSSHTDAALVLHWLHSVAGGSAAGETTQWPTRVAYVLRCAHNAVLQLEQERERDAARLTQCYDEMQRLHKRPQRKAAEDGEEVVFAQMVVQENRSLKKRLRALQELMESEVKAYESLWGAAQEGRPNDTEKEVEP